MIPWRTYQRSQKVTEIDHSYLSFVEEGQGDPVILLHGIPTWGYLWHEVAMTLATSHRVLIPDLIGFGFSDRSDHLDRSLSHQTWIIQQWMDRLGIHQATIIGHELGGGVALRLALLFPKYVKKLCLMDSVSYHSWPVESMLQFGHPAVDRILSAETAISILRRTIHSGFFAAPADEWIEGLLAPYSIEAGKISLIRDAVALNTNHTTELTPLLSRLTIPTLILWGEQDSYQSIKYGHRLASDIETSTFQAIAHAVHFIMIDRPQLVADHLLAFASSKWEQRLSSQKAA